MENKNEIINAKRILYSLLLQNDYKELSDTEIEIICQFAKDKDIQDIYDKILKKGS